MKRIENCIYNCELNSTELSLRDYVILEKNHVAKMTLKELSSTLFTSSSTIIQFLKKIGYAGFTDFKLSIKKEITQSDKSNPNNSYNQNSIDKFNELFASQDHEKISRIVDIISDKKSVYIHGRGMNSIAADYLFNNLLTLDVPSILVSEIQLLKKVSKSADEGTLIIVFSQESSHEEIVGVVENARVNGVSTLLITSQSNISDVAFQFTFVLYTNDKPFLLDGVDVNSRIGFFTVAQLLIEATSSRLLGNTNIFKS